MRVVIAGGHGQIARLLIKQLDDAGHSSVALIRNPEQADDVRGDGGEPMVLDLEHAGTDVVADALAGADAVVFAAGAGPGSSAELKLTVDRDGAVLLRDAAERARVRRYVMISAMAADAFDPGSDEIFQIYLRAKSEADAAVRASSLDWTVVRPGGLTDDAATGHIMAAERTGRGTIPRADVAAVVAYCLETPATAGLQFEVISGKDSIATAVGAAGT